jgi:hypothetical protein
MPEVWHRLFELRVGVFEMNDGLNSEGDDRIEFINYGDISADSRLEFQRCADSTVRNRRRLIYQYRHPAQIVSPAITSGLW